MLKPKRKPPWKRASPRKKTRKAAKHLTPTQKSAAKRRAEKAGRRYPNLVDNMAVAAKRKRKRKRGS